jgi:hypothetical protein
VLSWRTEHELPSFRRSVRTIARRRSRSEVVVGPVLDHGFDAGMKIGATTEELRRPMRMAASWLQIHTGSPNARLRREVRAFGEAPLGIVPRSQANA